MTREQFLKELGSMIDSDAPLTGTETLKGLAGWDSLAAVTFLAVAEEECGVEVAPKDIPACKTVNDLVALVSGGLEDAAAAEHP